MRAHIVLLGDSVFDNSSYTNGESDVIGHLRSLLPTGWEATLCAVDGDTTAQIDGQVARVPDDATHVVLSVGGNDALLNLDLLDQPADSSTEVLTLIGERVQQFEAAYRSSLKSVRSLNLETIVCTIYNGNLDPPEAEPARVALMTFNDVILRIAFEHGLSVIDLRLVCATPQDYANQIEPSGSGGAKIANAIARACGALDGGDLSSCVFSA